MTEDLRRLLKMNRQQQENLTSLSRDIVKALKAAPELRARVKALRTVKGVGEITALTWALEVGDPSRFSSHDKAVSYCGLCAAQHSSAGKDRRGPISKQRNAALQTVLIEAAHLAPRFNETLRAVREREIQKGAKDNEASIAVARKLVRYLLAIDRQFFANKAAAEAAGSQAAASARPVPEAKVAA